MSDNDVIIGGVKIPSTVSLFLNYGVDTTLDNAKNALRATAVHMGASYEDESLSYKEVMRRRSLLIAAEESLETFNNARQVRAILEEYWSGIKG